MTGKDLVLFIVNNDLLNVDVSKGIKNMFWTVEEAALKMGISASSLSEMIKIGIVDSVEFDGVTYVRRDLELTCIMGKKQNYR